MPLITISAGIGCGGMAVARMVADGLKLELFGDVRLQQEAIKMGLAPEELKDLGENAPGFLDRLVIRRYEIYLDYMEALIYEVAQKGEGVIIGHGSQVLLRDFHCALHVHIYTGESIRIRNLMNRRGMSEAAAERLIHRSDHEQKGFFRSAFHMDWNDPSLYDLIINTGQIGPDLASQVIMDVARSDQMKACATAALETMEKLSLKKRIRAALLENGIESSAVYLDVPQRGVVHIAGVTHSDKHREQIPEIIRRVPGVSKVQGEITVFIHYDYSVL